MALKTKLITMLLIGSSSVAVARPAVADHRISANVGFGASVSVRDHRGSDGYIEPGFHRTSYEYDAPRHRFPDHKPPRPHALLASGLHYEASQYRKDIVMTSQQSALRGLAIEGTRGQSYLMKVVIEFANGEVQQIPLNTILHGGQSLAIDLDGRFRKIHRILVYRADGHEALTLNRRHHGAFNVFGF